MDTQESGPSKEAEQNETACPTTGTTETSAVNYATTGARPKTFPMPTSSTNRQMENQKPFRPLKRPGNGTTGQTEDSDDEMESVFKNVDTGRKGSCNEVTMRMKPDGTYYIDDGGEDDGLEMPDVYTGEASSVEITMAEQISQLDLDAEYAKSLEYEDGVAAGGQPLRGSGFGFGAQEGFQSGGFRSNESGEGFEELADEFRAELTRSSELPDGLGRCCYCKRPYSMDFLETHMKQCVDNPAVHDEREDIRRAMDASITEQWRNSENPAPAAWTGPIKYPEPSEHSVIKPTEFQIGVWNQQTSAGGSEPVASGTCDDTEEALIPCENCNGLYPFSGIMDHQSVCGW